MHSRPESARRAVSRPRRAERLLTNRARLAVKRQAVVVDGIDIGLHNPGDSSIPLEHASEESLLRQNWVRSGSLDGVRERCVIGEASAILAFVEHWHLHFASPTPERLHDFILAGRFFFGPPDPSSDPAAPTRHAHKTHYQDQNRCQGGFQSPAGSAEDRKYRHGDQRNPRDRIVVAARACLPLL